jgi:hypothetical protein
LKLITVTGIETKTGATHLALSLCAKALAKGKVCGLIVAPACFDMLCRYFVVKIRQPDADRRIADFGGLQLMTGMLPGELSALDLLVWDLGLYEQSIRSFSQGDLRLLLSGGQAWELGPLNELLSDMPYESMEKLVICLRGIAAEEAGYLREQLRRRLRSIVIQHQPDWTQHILRDDTAEILSYIEPWT